MIEQIIVVTIDGEEIKPEALEVFEFNNDIKTSLPTLHLSIKDPRGDLWSKLRFSIGSKVVPFILSGKGQAAKINLTPFVITKMFNGLEFENKTLGGYIQIWAEQSWRLYSNFSDHAYEKKKLSETIYTVCKEASDKADIIVKEDNFEKSLDSGSIRYKVAMSDLDFIEQKLLPYTLIGTSNSLFFIDQYGFVILSSFSKLFSKKPKKLLTVDENIISYIVSAGEDNELSQYMKQKDLKGYTCCKIGASNIGSLSNTLEMVGQLNEKLYIHNNQTEEVYLGWQSPEVKAGANTQSAKMSYTPIKSRLIASSDATSAHIFEHLPFEDQVSLSRNNDIAVNDLLSLVVGFAGFDESITGGSTVDFWVPSTEEVIEEYDEDGKYTPKSTTPKKHWISGRWLVSKITINKTDIRNAATTLKLIKPTFTLNTKNTTLDDYRTFYSAIA